MSQNEKTMKRWTEKTYLVEASILSAMTRREERKKVSCGRWKTGLTDAVIDRTHRVAYRRHPIAERECAWNWMKNQIYY